jgi:hypothetical protein
MGRGAAAAGISTVPKRIRTPPKHANIDLEIKPRKELSTAGRAGSTAFTTSEAATVDAFQLRSIDSELQHPRSTCQTLVSPTQQQLFLHHNGKPQWVSPLQFGAIKGGSTIDENLTPRGRGDAEKKKGILTPSPVGPQIMGNVTPSALRFRETVGGGGVMSTAGISEFGKAKVSTTPRQTTREPAQSSKKNSTTGLHYGETAAAFFNNHTEQVDLLAQKRLLEEKLRETEARLRVTTANPSLDEQRAPKSPMPYTLENLGHQHSHSSTTQHFPPN